MLILVMVGDHVLSCYRGDWMKKEFLKIIRLKYFETYVYEIDFGQWNENNIPSEFGLSLEEFKNILRECGAWNSNYFISTIFLFNQRKEAEKAVKKLESIYILNRIVR